MNHETIMLPSAVYGTLGNNGGLKQRKKAKEKIQRRIG